MSDCQRGLAEMGGLRRAGRESDENGRPGIARKGDNLKVQAILAANLKVGLQHVEIISNL
jgi:hypothetical protein